MTTNCSYKILFHVSEGIGHMNACIGLAQSLQQRGHQIIFFSKSVNKGFAEKYGFKEILLQSMSRFQDNEMKDDKTSDDKNEQKHPLDRMMNFLMEMKESGLLSGKSPYEKLDLNDPKNPKNFFTQMVKEMVINSPQILQAIHDEKPDFIIVDQFLVVPSIAFGDVPWAFLFSGNPLFMLDNLEQLPPPTSGYPTNGNKEELKKFREKFEKTTKASFNQAQCNLNKELGFPSVDPKQFLPLSKYLNIYGYPEELDYLDIIKLPDNFVRCDAFYRNINEQFEIPEEFKAKIKPGDKLIYLSMGSMGAIDVDLMKKLTGALASTPYKYIVSKGPLHEKYELPDNMWGQAFLPQTKVLPIVDMVITHGGNNTVTETFANGKPMLVLPLFADQYDNAQRILEKGFGGRLSAYNCTDDELRAEVTRIINDEQIKERCQKASNRMKQVDSKAKVCERIEQVIKQQKV